jgi:hypothetical protein
LRDGAVKRFASSVSPGLSKNGLRKACRVRPAEAGRTDHELGQGSIAQLQVYTGEANRKKMTQSATAKITQIANTR